MSANDVKAARIVSQRREAKHGVIVTCACERRSHFLWMYRCYYCGEFYCERCAPDHFGKTREEYRAAHIAEQVPTGKKAKP